MPRFDAWNDPCARGPLAMKAPRRTEAARARLHLFPGRTWALAGSLVALVATAAACEPPREPPGTDTAEPDEPLGEASQAQTVGQAANNECSTGSVRGLSLQIIEQGNCIEPGAFTEVPDLGNVTFGENVFPFLEEPARDALVNALESSGMSITFNSMLRTVAQQYLLYRWDQQGRCGISIAASPGNSNHETGLAFDTSQYSAWRSILENNGFRWFGSGDAVHFDYVGPGAVDHRGVDVKAFQQLWNMNHPDDLIDEDGLWGPQTENRMQQSPAEGFAIGPDCSRPPPAEGPDVVPTVSIVDAEDIYSDGASASVPDVFEGDRRALTFRIENQGGATAGGIVLGVEIDDPWLVASSYLIETDFEHPGEFEENDSNTAAENPPHDADLPRSFDLHVFGLSAGETKRVTLDLDAIATSVQQATQPGVRMWVKHIDEHYDQATFGGAPTGDGSQTFNQGILEVALPLDVYSHTRWEWESDRREGWTGPDPTSTSLADGALVVQGAGRSPLLDTGGKKVTSVRLRAMRSGGTGDAILHLLASETDELGEGETFPIDLDDDGAFHEVEIAVDADFAPAIIAIEPFEGDGGTLGLDHVRLDLGGDAPAGEGGGSAEDGDDDDGDGPLGDGDGDGDGEEDGDGAAAEDDGEGCSCRAAGAPAGGDTGAALAAVAVAALASRRRRR